MLEVSVLGAGRVGVSLAYVLQEKGYKIVAVASRSSSSLEIARKFLAVQLFTQSFSEAASKGKVIFISTSDDAIREVCQSVASEGGFRKGQCVFHFSGALDLSVLEPAAKQGAFIGSIHPLQTFPDIKAGIEKIPGSYFGVTTRSIRALEMAKEIVKIVEGKFFEVEEDLKPLYHAAACLASNYFDALIYMSSELYSRIGASEKEALAMMEPLIKATWGNIRAKGSAAALTGPIARGDLETIKKHISLIEKKFPQFLSAYKEMGKITAIVARKKGLSEERFKEILNLLGK